jgi:hypothetical protein
MAYYKTASDRFSDARWNIRHQSCVAPRTQTRQPGQTTFHEREQIGVNITSNFRASFL